MYTAQQLHALDFLLKKLLKSRECPFYEKNLKWVIEVDGQYWYGDFVNLSGNSVKQLFIDDSGDIDHAYLDATSNNATVALSKIWKTYHDQVKGFPFGDPFRKTSDLTLLFNALVKILDLAKVETDDSPLYPYLLNANSLDKSQELPFLNLGHEPVKLVSLIEVQ